MLSDVPLHKLKSMSQTRAKFVCTEVIKRVGWGGVEFVYAAKFNVVVSGSEENSRFFSSTPGGFIEISTIREDVFEVGKSYYVDFTLAQ